MQIQPASHPSVHTPAPAAAHPAPSQSFSSHIDAKKRASAKSSSSSRAPSSASAPSSPTTASGGTTATAPPAGSSAASTSGTSASTAGTPTSSSVQSSVDQSDDDNMQFLQLQEQMDNQSEMFTTMSNVEKTETDTIKNTAQNMAI
jgi:hypothetical protein